jgi:hypothetical protein
MRLRDWWEMMACYAGGMAAADQRHRVPQPFLGPLFAPGVEPLIATGFHYTRREIEVHGVETHNAIDFDLPRGTPVLAPADGYYVATYGEVLIRDKHGEPVTRSLAEAKAGNPHNRDFRPPQHGQRWPIYYGSFVVQGWHGRGRYTQYAHLDAVDPHIPYYPPSESEQGDLHFSPTPPAGQTSAAPTTPTTPRRTYTSWCSALAGRAVASPARSGTPLASTVISTRGTPITGASGRPRLARCGYPTPDLNKNDQGRPVVHGAASLRLGASVVASYMAEWHECAQSCPRRQQLIDDPLECSQR